MSYLLDASTLAEVLRSSPPQPLVRKLAQVPTRERWTSVVTVSQLLLAARRARQPRTMQEVVRLVAAVRVVPYDIAAARAFAKYRANVGPEVSNDDVMIAAIAQSRALTVVTRRLDVFSRFEGLRAEDWTG